MERKDNDLMMNMVANPEFSIADFATIGFNMNNTSLQDASVYKNNPYIQQKFTDNTGKFNETAFQNAYQSAVIGYNQMSQKNFEQSQLKIFHRDDILAPREMRREGPDFRQVIMSNPDRITNSMYRLGEEGPRTKSRDELAQANRVLLNPNEVYKNGNADWSKAKWGDSPNDSFWGYFTDTLVMAQYDSDGTHVDPVTGQTVEHRKGDPIINPDGTYFYEKLDGRDIYGRRVLNKMNVLTTDGSFWNKYDFFDSDDIDQKSIGGTIMKNLALVGSMFIPYVGPWVVGASIATQLVGLMGTLGKMFTGSESPLFSAMEGWSSSLDRQTAKSEYAQENTWCWENFISLIGDVAGQLKEQRFFFEKVPALFKGSYAGSNKAYAAKLAKFEEAEKALTETKLANLEKLVKSGEKTADDFLKAASEWRSTNTINAQGQMNSWMKGYNKIGEIFSKGYMTAITVGDTYGEAKEAGASDLEATLLTLGYAAGEYAILNTGIGEWILPELRADRYKNQAIIRAISELKKEAKDSYKDLGKALVSKGDKKEWAKKIFQIGKNIAKAEYSNGTRTLQATMAAGLGEGVEEVTEELLADFSKGCFNVVQWLSGDDTRMRSFGYQWDEDGNRTWNGKEVWDRYGMSFFGGLVGGALTNAGTSYRTNKSLSGMTSEQAIQEIVYMARNNQLESLYKTLDKMEVADKRMSATEFEEVDGKYIAKPGTTENNRDVYVKQAIRNQIRIIDEILKSEGADFSDSSFLHGQTEVLKDLRFNALHNAVTAGIFMQEYNKLCADIVELVDNINKGEQAVNDTNNDGKTSDKEKRDGKKNIAAEQNLKKLKSDLNEKRKQLKELVEGKRSDEFVKITLYELTQGLHRIPYSFPLYVQAIKGKKLSDLKPEEKNTLREEYRKWLETDGKDRIADEAKAFNLLSEQVSELIKTQYSTYQNQSEEIKNITNSLRNLFSQTNIRQAYSEAQTNGPINFESFFINFAQNLIKPIVIGGQITRNLYADEVEQIANSLKSEIDSANAITDPEQKTKAFNLINTKFDDKLYQLIHQKINDYIAPFVQQGFANIETKNELSNVIKGLIEYYQTKQRQEQLDPDVINGLRPAVNYLQNNKSLSNLLTQINDLNNTPLEILMNQFALSIGETPINFTQIVDKLNDALNKIAHNVQDFNTDLNKELNNAINLAKLYKQVINGAKTDNINLSDPFGYNQTVNKVSKALGKDANLAEIDTQFADLLIADIDNNLNKLEFLKKLYSINQGQKATRQNRIGIKKDILLYKGLRNIISIKDDDLKEVVNELNSVLEGLKLFKDIEKNKNYSLSLEQRIEFEKQKFQMEDAIHKMFNSKDSTGKTLLDDPIKLQKIIRAFDVYSLTNDLLNEELEELDGPSMIWYLAQRAAIKSSDFHTAFLNILNPKDKIMPISTQEMAVYSNYASLINGNVITKVFDAYRSYIKDDWKNDKSIDQRKEILRKLNRSEVFAEDKYADYCFNFLPIPRYSNISLVEGAPGTGKSEAVIRLTGIMLNTYHKDMLDNVAIVHAANIESADKLQKGIGVNGKTFDHKSFCEEIIDGYTTPKYNDKNVLEIKSGYDFNSDNELVSTQNIKNTTTSFSLIVIDEISKFNVFELDAINKYAKEHGITVIAAGDFDQSGAIGIAKTKYADTDINLEIELDRNMFNRSPKLGVSVRTENILMSNNLINFRTWMYSDMKKENLTLYYIENDEGLFGTRTFYNDEIDDIQSQIDTLINSLTDEEKEAATRNDNPVKPIGFIYSDPDSEIYKYLHDSPEISKYIDFKEGGSAQGLEAKYYVIDASNLDQSDDNQITTWKRDLYTGISRAKQGAIVITDLPNEFDENDIPAKIHSKVGSELIKDPLDDQIIQKYTVERINVLKESVNGEVPQYIARTKEGKPSINGNTTLTGIDVPLSVLPENIRTNLKGAYEAAKTTPKVDNDLIPADQNDSEYSYGDLIKYNNDQYGIIVGISKKKAHGLREFEILMPIKDTTNSWGYTISRISELDIVDVLFHKNTNKPKIPLKNNISKGDLHSKYGSAMNISSIKIEYDGKEAELDLVPIRVIQTDAGGNVNFLNTNVVDYDGNKIVLVEIGDYIQPFYCNYGTWHPFFGLNNSYFNEGNSSDLNYDFTYNYNNPIFDAISKQLNIQLGNSVGPIPNFCPYINLPQDINLQNILSEINQSFENIFEKQPGTQSEKDILNQTIDKAKQSIQTNWDNIATPIRSTSTETITLNQNGTDQNLKVEDIIYDPATKITITDIQTINGKQVIYFDYGGPLNLEELQKRIDNGLLSLSPFSNELLIKFGNIELRIGDKFYTISDGERTITDIYEDNGTLMMVDSTGVTWSQSEIEEGFDNSRLSLTPFEEIIIDSIKLNDIEVKVGDIVYDSNRTQSEILEINKDNSNNITVKVTHPSGDFEMSLDEFQAEYTTKEPIYYENSIDLDGNILRIGDTFEENGITYTITNIKPYQTGNSQIIYESEGGTTNSITYKQLLKNFRKNKITISEQIIPSELELDIFEQGNDSLDNSNETEEGRKSEIDNQNTDSKPLILDQEPVGLNIFLYTMNSFELGAVVENGNFIFNDFSNKRIDGVNGLRRIKRLTNSNMSLSVEDVTSQIGYIRGLILNAINKADLAETLQDELGLGQLNIDFAFKTSTIRWKNQKKQFLNNTPNPYATNVNERSLFHRGNDSRSGEIAPHKIVAIINSSQFGDVLEIPLFTLTSPLTIAQLTNEDGTPKYPELYSIIQENEELIEDYKNNPEKYSEEGKPYDSLRELVQKLAIASKSKEISDLCKLFLFSYNGLFRFQDKTWLPSTHLKNLGSQFANRKGLWHLESGFNYDATNKENWMPISEYLKDPQVTVSPILKSPSNILELDNVSIENKIKVGHPFVFISHDPNLSASNIQAVSEQWLKQQDPNYDGIPSVRLHYIYTPEVDLVDYFEQLNSVLFKKDKDFRYLLGNSHTPYNILKNVINDEKFLNLAKERLDQQYHLPALLNYLQELSKIDPEDPEYHTKLHNALYGDDSYVIISKSENKTQKVKLGTWLGRVLVSIVYAEQEDSFITRKQKTIDPKAFNIIKDILNANDIRIFYWPKASGNVGQFLTVDIDTNYQINGKDCLINGKIDSPVFIGDISEMVSSWVNEIEEAFRISKTAKSVSDMRYEFKKRNHSQNFKEYLSEIDRLNKIQDERILKAIQSHNSNYNSIFQNTDSTNFLQVQSALNDVVFRLRNNGILAFNVNNKILISENLPNNVTNVQVVYNDGSIKYNLDDIKEITIIRHINGDAILEHYNIQVDGNKIELTPQKSNIPIEINAPTIDTFNTIMQYLDPNIKENSYLKNIIEDINDGLIETQDDLELELLYDSNVLKALQELKVINPNLQQLIDQFAKYIESQNPEIKKNKPDVCNPGIIINLI